MKAHGQRVETLVFVLVLQDQRVQLVVGFLQTFDGVVERAEGEGFGLPEQRVPLQDAGEGVARFHHRFVDPEGGELVVFVLLSLVVRPIEVELGHVVHFEVLQNLVVDVLVPEPLVVLHDGRHAVDLQELHGRVPLLQRRRFQRPHEGGVGELVGDAGRETGDDFALFSAVNEGLVLPDGRVTAAPEADAVVRVRHPNLGHDHLVQRCHPLQQFGQLGILEGLRLVLDGQLLADAQRVLPVVAVLEVLDDFQVQLLFELPLRLALAVALPTDEQRRLRPLQQPGVLPQRVTGLRPVLALLVEVTQLLQVLQIQFFLVDGLVKLQQVDNARHLILFAVFLLHDGPVLEQVVHQTHHQFDEIGPRLVERSVALAKLGHDLRKQSLVVDVAAPEIDDEFVQKQHQFVFEFVKVLLADVHGIALHVAVAPS